MMHKHRRCAVEVTSCAVGDAPLLPDLLNQIAQQEEIAIGAVAGPKCQRVIGKDDHLAERVYFKPRMAGKMCLVIIGADEYGGT